jgi:hypothetical protein
VEGLGLMNTDSNGNATVWYSVSTSSLSIAIEDLFLQASLLEPVLDTGNRIFK